MRGIYKEGKIKGEGEWREVTDRRRLLCLLGAALALSFCLMLFDSTFTSCLYSFEWETTMSKIVP